MTMNSYWKNASGLLAKEDSSQDKVMERYGWTRVTRDEYRKLVRARERSQSHDMHTAGESANEVGE